MITKLITASLIMLVSSITVAEEIEKPALKEYDVEIIIFEDAHARYINSQTWDYQNPAMTSNSRDGVPENLDNPSLKEIKAFDFTQRKPSILSTEYRRMKLSSEYKILFYAVWRQAGLGADNAVDIDIAELTNNHKSNSSSTLSGTVKVILKRYLHLYTSLDYQRETTFTVEKEVTAAEDTAESGTPIPVAETVTKHMSYPVNAHRRMRSKELHYIDHPLVGILIQINPVEQPKSDEG